ncbi:tetratricopeptide repeat protein [Nonomuraea typhae]|uniref:tetratricopeptide repeat protein n=1 Tax=Nonomuraea typhae TaxID=2603600 RepID=UPI0012F72495|nr:tetratricopeptide repeat protein [Nonomuraea typhae]
MRGKFSVAPPFQRKSPRLRGRDALLAVLTSAGPDQTAPRVHVLHGLGGCGKSEIALAVARRMSDLGWQVWWIDARHPEQISAGMREIAGRLGASDSQLELVWAGKGRNPVDLVWDLLDGPFVRPWLLIFDNADQPQLLSAVEGLEGDEAKDAVADGTGWLRQPATGDCLVLVTTRDGNARTWGTWSALHEVRDLEPGDGAHVLIDVAGESSGSAEDAEALAVKLSCHPLTLTKVGAYLERAKKDTVWSGDSITTFQAYLTSFDRRLGLLPAAGAQEDSPSLGQAMIKTWQVWEMSIEQLGTRGLTRAGQVLYLLSTFGDAPISYAILLDPARLTRTPLFGPITREQLLETIGGLADFKLLEPKKLDESVLGRTCYVATLHPLVRELTRRQLGILGQRRSYLMLAVQLLARLRPGEPFTLKKLDFDPDEPGHWPMWQMLTPQCVEVILDYLEMITSDEAEQGQDGLLPIALDVARLIARYLLAFGLPKQAELFLERCLGRCRELGLDMDGRPILNLRHERARAALEQGRLEWAEAELRRIIPLRVALLGQENLDTLFSRHKLARVLMEQERWAAAEAELREVAAGEARICGPENHDTLTARHSLAKAILATPGRVAEAEEMIDEIMEIRQRHWKPSHFDTLTLRYTRARAWLARGAIEAAIGELRQVLEDAAAVERTDHPEMLALRHTLAVALLSGPAPAPATRREALAALERLLVTCREVLGDNHKQTRRVARDLDRLDTGE